MGCVGGGTDGGRAGRWLAGERRVKWAVRSWPGRLRFWRAMIQVPGGVRVWLETGVTDMRRGMNTLALQVVLATSFRMLTYPLPKDLPNTHYRYPLFYSSHFN